MIAYRSFWVPWITAQTLLVLFGCSRADQGSVAHSSHGTTSLGRSEVEGWFAARFSASKPVHFFSDHGTRLCCEYPNIAIEFRSDHTGEIATDGWVPKRRIVTYTVGQDGRITLATQSKDLHETLESTYVYLVPDGSDMYLVQDLTTPPDFANHNDHTWPLKFIESGDWLTPPK
jgi:hypothetical protein